MNDNEYVESNRRLRDFWTDQMLSGGFVAVPTLLLEYRQHLGINTTELTVLLAMLSFRHSSKPIYPSINKISDRAGVEPRVIYRATSSMEKRGLLRKDPRPGHTTLYDLGGLVDELKIIDKYMRVTG